MLGRFVCVLIVAGALLAGGFVFDFIANEPGQLTIDYADRVYEFTLFEAALILVLAILAASIAGIYPALRMARISPAGALRED